MQVKVEETNTILIPDDETDGHDVHCHAILSDEQAEVPLDLSTPVSLNTPPPTRAATPAVASPPVPTEGAEPAAAAAAAAAAATAAPPTQRLTPASARGRKAPPPPRDVTLGCSKCRKAQSGCKTCRARAGISLMKDENGFLVWWKGAIPE